MLKKILISIFATLIVGAASVSAYNTATTPTVVSAQIVETEEEPIPTEAQTEEEVQIQESFALDAQPEPQTQVYGQNYSENSGDGYRGSGNNGVSQTTIHGTLVDIGFATVTLTTDAGDTLTVALDAATLGITLLPGDGITLSGFWSLDETFTVGQITLDSTGQTYTINGNDGKNGAGYRGGGSGGGGNGGGGKGNSVTSP